MRTGEVEKRVKGGGLEGGETLTAQNSSGLSRGEGR